MSPRNLIRLVLTAPALAGAAAAQSSTPLPPWSWVDFDGDRALDVLVISPEGAPRLHRNGGAAGFVDVSESAGLGGLSGATQAVWADVDRDARLDLLLVVPGGASRLLLQSEGRTFVDGGARSGLPLASGVARAAALDLDGDGAADLWLSTTDGERVWHNLGDGSFADSGLELPARAPASRPGRGEESATFGAGLSGATPGGLRPAAPGMSGLCAGTLLDSIVGGCLSASVVPTLGMLYPLSNDFFVAPSGFVGIGTTAPGTPLDVAGDLRSSGRLISTAPSGAPLSVASSALVPNLNADRLDGLHASDFSQLGASIGTTELEDGAVTTAKLATKAVTGNEIAPGAVASVHIAVDSVTASAIAANAVASAEIATDAVGSGEIATGAVGADEVADGSLTAADLAPGAIGSSALGPGSVADVHVAAGAAIAGTKIAPDFGAQDVDSTGRGLFGSAAVFDHAVRGVAGNGPTNGYVGLAPQGPDFDGIASADWSGWEIGMAGISVGASTNDNYGVVGHATAAGVRGENASAPLVDWGELGLDGIGLRATGSAKAAELLGNVDIDGLMAVAGGNNTLTTLEVENPLGGSAGLFRSTDDGGTTTGYTLSALSLHEGGALIATQSNVAATAATAFLSSQSASSINRVLHAVKSTASTGDVAFIDANNTGHSGIVLNVRQRGTGRGLLVDAQGGGLAADLRASGNVLKLDNVLGTGNIMEAWRGSDLEFRVATNGNVHCDGAFVGGGADYAEWLVQADPFERFQPGDVVGVHAGRVSKRLAGASQVLVVSTSPAVLGNAPESEDDARALHQMVAFLGQVPTRVVGPVAAGDLIVPSGLDDGTAIAIPPAQLGAGDVGRVIGTAWEDADAPGLQTVNVAVGIDQARSAALALQATHARAELLEARLAKQERELADLRGLLEALTEVR
jgi:hypothetical protein